MGADQDSTLFGDEEQHLEQDAVWKANVHRYELYLALLESGDSPIYSRYSVRHPITGDIVRDRSYLRRLAGEGESSEADAGGYRDAFARRRDAGFHFDISAQIIHTYVDTLSRQQIDRSAVSAIPQLAPVLRDVDLQGTPVDAWIAWAYYLGLGLGWHATLVEAPPSSTSRPSRYHELASGDRPSARIYLPHRIWRLERDQSGRVTHALIHEGDGLWVEWDDEAWYEIDASGNVVRSGAHGFGTCPIELYVANPPVSDDPKAPPGLSAIRAIALVDVAILNHISLGDDTHTKTAFPFYHLQADRNDDRLLSSLSLGAGSIFAYDAAGDWQAPPEHCAKINWTHIDRLEALAYKMGGVHRRSQDSVEAHSGLALDWENAPIHATVARWALQLRAWELRLWRRMGEALGVGANELDALDVVYPDDFSSRPVDQSLSYAERITAIYNGSPPPWVAVGRDALVRLALERLVGHQRDVAAVIPKRLDSPPASDVVQVFDYDLTGEAPAGLAEAMRSAEFSGDGDGNV